MHHPNVAAFIQVRIGEHIPTSVSNKSVSKTFDTPLAIDILNGHQECRRLLQHSPHLFFLRTYGVDALLLRLSLNLLDDLNSIDPLVDIIDASGNAHGLLDLAAFPGQRDGNPVLLHGTG
ncbi:MAG: hypothetical protein C3F08_01955 [Candidatus Methylomirabilota bacterium]|nr:MAG: hypothetical protein C3F08_01955 [candidate division NC10 bacterium]